MRETGREGEWLEDGKTKANLSYLWEGTGCKTAWETATK